MKKLAIISSHPIQYYAPVFKLLAQTAGFDVKVFYTWGEDSLKKHDPGFGKTIEWDIPLLDGYPYQFLKNTSKNPGTHHFWGIINPQAIKQVTSYQPDAILVYGWSWYSHFNLIRHFKNKIPVYFRGDSTLLDHASGWQRAARQLFLKWIYRYIDKAFYVGSNNKAYFLKHGIKEDQLEWAPHAIDNSSFGTNFNEAAAQLRKKFGIEDSDILILFAGKLEEKKDPEILLKAFAELDLKHVHLLFTGNGILENHLKTHSSKLATSKRIHFRDFQNQSILPAYYQACDLFCLPSKGPGETWGLAVNEAMACSKAVLVSDKTGCAADLVEPGINGAVFKAGDIDELKEKLSALVSSKTALIEMGKQSQSIIQNFTFEHQAKVIANSLSQL